jgi:ferritin-like metal-binding protein YciE
LELESLRALYVDELEDPHSAEGQVLKALRRMIRAASNRELKKAPSLARAGDGQFDDHRR